MSYQELLPLLISLLSLTVGVAILVGLFSAIVKFVSEFGLPIILVIILYFLLVKNGIDITQYISR
jgi:uncharacterized protein (DUF2062 family)